MIQQPKRHVGRPKAKPTKTMSFRLDAEALATAKKLFGRGLNKKVSDFIKSIIKDNWKV